MNPLEEKKADGDSLDERLVAYLDGELDADAQSQVEQQLAEDAQSRNRLRELQQTWDLLDHLPNAQTDRTFTETTVEMVAAKASEDIQTQQQTCLSQHRKSWVYRGGLFAAAVVLGYLVFYATAARRENKLLSDLPVIENMDLYRHVESVSFLQQLDQDELFGSEDLIDEEQSQPARLFVDFDVTALRRRTSELTSVEKAQLQDQKERFDRLAPGIQAQRRRIHADVVANPDAGRLFQVMAEYHGWLTSLDTEDRSKLLALEPDDRLKRIKEIKGQQDSELFLSLMTDQITAEDFAVILDWHREFGVRHKDEAIARSPEGERERWKQMADRGGRFFPFWLLPEPTDEEIDELAEELSDEAQVALRSAADTGERAELVDRWFGAAMASRRRPHVEEEELQKFFREELEEKQQRELAKMDPKDADRELRRLHFHKHFASGGFSGGPPGWGPRGPGFGPSDSRRGRPPRGFSEGMRDREGGPEPRGRRSLEDRSRERGRETRGQRPFDPRDGGAPTGRPDRPEEQRRIETVAPPTDVDR